MGDAAYHSMRLQSIENLAANGVSAYPHKFQATMSVPQYVQTYAHLAEKQTLNEVTVSLAGRMYRRHSSGAKLFVFDIRADGGQVQIFVDKRYVLSCIWDFTRLRARALQPPNQHDAFRNTHRI